MLIVKQCSAKTVTVWKLAQVIYGAQVIDVAQVIIIIIIVQYLYRVKSST